jgi:uncharacterized protein (TIGR02996 family)
MITDADALLATIIDNPECDAPRLVYADAIEEAGEVDRAEFIRVQCELASWRKDSADSSLSPSGIGRHEMMRTRERLLLKYHYHEWFDVPGPWMPHGYAPAGHHGSICEVFLSSTDNAHLCSVIVERGLISCVTCTFADFEKYGPEIVRRHPIRPHAGMVTDRRPAFDVLNPARSVWLPFFGDTDRLPTASHIPLAVFRLLAGGGEDGYDTRDAAMLALATAMIAWARAANLNLGALANSE